MSNSPSFIIKLKDTLREDEWPWVISALRQDPVIWQSLQDPNFGELALSRGGDQPSNWTPAGLAFLALGCSSPSTGDPVDPELIQKAGKVYQDLLAHQANIPEDLSPLALAGLLAIALAELHKEVGSWEVLPSALHPVNASVWPTTLACLFGLSPDPADLLYALIQLDDINLYQDLALHALFSNPLHPTRQVQILKSLLAGLPLSDSGSLFKRLKALRPALAKDLALDLLDQETISLNQNKSSSKDERLDQLEQYLQLAEFNAAAEDHDQTTALRKKALEVTRRLQFDLHSELLETEALLGDIDTALKIWQKNISTLEDILAPLKRMCPPDTLVKRLLDAGRPADVLALLSESEAGFPGNLQPGYLLAAARLAVSQGDMDQAREVTRQALQAALRENVLSVLPTLAQLFLELSLPEEAISTAQIALSSQPNDPQLLLTLSKAYRAAGDLEAAITYAHLAIVLEPESANLRRELAECLEASGDWTAALSERTTLLENRFAPSSGETWPLATDLRSLANCALNAGQPRSAANACQHALEIDQEDGLAHAIMGEAHSVLGDNQTALAHFQQATQFAPHQSAPWLALARVQQRSGQVGKTVETLRAASHAVPKDPLIQLNLAEAYLTESAYTQALSALRRAYELLPEQSKTSPTGELSIRIILRLGQTLQRLGHTAQARQILLKAYQVKPAYPGLAYAYAQTLLAQGELEAARAPLVVAVRSEPDIPAPYLDYARTLLGADYPIKPNLAGRPENDPVEAVRVLQKALDLAPKGDTLTRAIALALMAEALAGSGNLEASLQAYYHALETELVNDQPWRTRLSLGLGHVALELNQTETAIAALQEAARADPQNSQVQRTLSQAYSAMHLSKEAMLSARAAMQLAPDDVETLSWFVERAILHGSPAEAIPSLTRAVQIDPGNPQLLLRLGQAQTMLGQDETARETYKLLFTSKGAQYEDLLQAAQGLLGLKDPSTAITCLERAQELSGKPTAELLCQLVLAYQQNGRLDLAQETLDQAIQIAPHDASLHLSKADLLLLLKRPQAAQASLEHALNLRPEDPVIHERLALLLRADGNLSAALIYAEQMIAAIEQDPELEGSISRALSARALAADLALAQLDHERARGYLEYAIPENYTLLPDSLPFFCLSADLALEAGEEVAAAEDLTAALELDRNHPRVMALQVRLLNRRGDPRGALLNLHNLLERLGRNDHFSDHISSAADLQSVAAAAIELNQWETGLYLLRRAADLSPLEPFEHLQIARALVLRGEYQLLCQSLEVVTNAPGQAALSEHAHKSFEEALLNASRTLSSGNNVEDSEDHSLIQRWQARGLAVFQPGPERIQALQNLSKNPDDLAALIAALYQMGHLAAIAQIQKAVFQEDGKYDERSPFHPAKHPLVLAQLALSLGFNGRRQKDLEDALEAAKAAAKGYPNLPLYHALHARLAHRAEETETALHAIHAALSIWSDEPRWHALAATMQLSIGQIEEALKHFMKAAALEPRYLPHHLALGEAYLESGQLANAIQAFEQAVRVAPDVIEPHLALARTYFRNGDWKNAAKYAEHAIKLEPDQINPLLLRAEIALQAGDLQAAQHHTKVALGLNPNDVSVMQLSSKALARLGRPGEALATLERAIPNAADPLPLMLDRVNLIEKIKGSEAAFAALQELNEQFPEEPAVLAPLAKSLAAAGQREAAIHTAQKALRKEYKQLRLEEAARLHLLLGRLLRQAGQLDQAIHQLSEAIQLAPIELESYLELGSAQQERRQHAQALKTYQKAIAVDPLDYRPYYQSGLALKEGRDYQGAEKMLRYAANLAPDDLIIHRQLAAIVALNLVHNHRPSSVDVTSDK